MDVIERSPTPQRAIVLVLRGTTAIVVITGGPDTGITGWTRDPGSTVPLDATPFDQPPGAYITWNHGGLTFRISRPDANTITLVAQQLHAA